ncbi:MULTISPECIES: MCE family protein [unclassified Rhodococcus (in: high G+C Gram-positive bacteria)]|uniref:MCE family protein n=1 Tax=unclassified Rhodococcus (in: high G+C Gram-positive bacteria) TaxID=192944 RepID=UPI00163B0A14|nr:MULTISPECIES: MCE family protein [unclassified Rhodococcus (in: high G+C Gram-positive bacteria)]MBC2639336.1 MCE family protein [Rhodococcus sp. 3A]MBC2895919.1 MCE family protein [Rhodococcus sp. 4CII]
MSNTTSVAGRRVLGLVFFLVLALFLAFTIGMFNKTFTKVVKVDLLTDTAGNALPPNADVKVRGLIVGEVRSASTSEGEVTLALAIQPDKAPLIPSNATARLLPKTLFGERYVSLIVPEGDTAPPIQAGDTLRQDKSGNAVEVGEVLDGLLPLLQAIPPQDLANTLGALSQGLSGRGAELGLTLDRLEEIFGGLNTELPAIQEDLRGLADFSQTYSEAAPELVNALDNLRTTGNTVVEKQGEISTLLASLTGTASSTADLLQTNAESIVSIAADSREALQILGRYSPSFGCTFAGFAKSAPVARELLAPDDPYPGVRASVQFVNPKGRYVPNQDEPRLLDNRGPACYDNVTAPGGKFPQYPGGSSYNDGAYQVPSRNPGPSTIDFLPAPAGVPDQVPGYGAQVTPASYAGSKMEQDTLDVVYGEAGGMAPEDVPSWTTLVGAPTMRGTEVSFK